MLSALTVQAQEVAHQTQAASGFFFLQSLTIILREGIEAALLLALMLTCLTATGYHRFRKHVVWGAAAGVIFGVMTWWIVRFALRISPLQQEALEGITSLLAAAVLFSVSFWVIYQVDIRHWKRYIQSRAEQALITGSGFSLASSAFLAVYREAVETVLFYEVLWSRSNSRQVAILMGLATGAVVLAVTVVAMFRFGLHIPLKPFFVITGLLLGVLAFVFAGYGVRELQAIGWIKITPLDWMIVLPLLEIRSTLESLGLQLGILLSFLIGWFSLTQLAPGSAAVSTAQAT